MDRNDDSNTTTATAASVPVKPMAPMASSSSLPFCPTKRPASPTNSSQADFPEPEAKKQKVTEKFRCDVCTVDCNSESCYESHMIGKKHHKQMKMFPKVSSNAIKMQQGSSPTDLLEPKAENERITATFRCDVCSVDCESKSDYELHMSSLGKKHDIMTATFGCDVCLVDCKEFYSYKVHVSGKNHHKKTNISPVSPKSIQISQDSSPTVVLEPKAENEEITAAFRCDVCSVDCDDKSGYEFHMLGKKHHIMTATFRCVICLVECLTKSSYDSHLLGRKHHNNMQTFRCNICSVNCGDKSGYEFHMLGKKHRIMTSGCQATFRCDICLVDCQNKSSYDSHLLGRKHLNKMQGPQHAFTRSPFSAVEDPLIKLIQQENIPLTGPGVGKLRKKAVKSGKEIWASETLQPIINGHQDS